jgi:hypothetical protein
VSLFLPLAELVGFTSWSDVLGRHQFTGLAFTDWRFRRSPGWYFEYVNGCRWPWWGLNTFRKTNFQYRRYDSSDSGLLEVLDGWNFWLGRWFHSRESSSTKGGAKLLLSTLQRHPERLRDWVGGSNRTHPGGELPEPQGGRETALQGDFQVLHRRSRASNLFLPREGWGLRMQFRETLPRMSDFHYRRVLLDGFLNLHYGKLPPVLFWRVTVLGSWGDPPAQDILRLVRDLPLYAPGNNPWSMVFPENYNPRGWDGVRSGDRLVFSSLELRIPLLSGLPVNVFGLEAGSLSGALISDQANAWWVGRPSQQEKWVVTAGGELRLALRFAGLPLVQLAVGKGQTIADWREAGHSKTYLRLALVNPF